MQPQPTCRPPLGFCASAPPNAMAPKHACTYARCTTAKSLLVEILAARFSSHGPLTFLASRLAYHSLHF